MAIATAVTSYVVALGPIKVEFVQGTFAADGDTYESKLVRPVFAFGQKEGSGKAQTQVTVSGKTVTVADAGISTTKCTLLVVGF